MALNELEFKLRKLFVVAKGLEMNVGLAEFDDLFFALLDEVKQVHQIYNENVQELMEIM